jgi:hypothetical protein
MAIRQTRVFVPYTETSDWAETLIGRVFRQVVQEFDARLRWFWFSRYVCIISMPGEDVGNCEFDTIPAEFKRPFPGCSQAGHRSLRFRFEIDDSDQAAFETRLQQLLGQYGYAFSDIRDYDQVEDTGGPRFLGVENRQSGRDIQRARLVTALYHVISQIVMDALVGPDQSDHYHVEHNDNQQNPHGATFESLHRLFCNITQVPISVLIQNQLLVRTFWGQPIGQQTRQINGQVVTEIFLSY